VWIRNLSLKNFRNYRYLDFEFDAYRQIALVGLNAQGKTNFLESLYLLAFLSSFRTGNLHEVIYWDESIASVRGILGYQKSTPVDLFFSIHKNNKRIARVDNVSQKKLADYIGYLQLVCFSAKDLQMITGSPALRRQFIDLFLSQIYSGYYALLQKYQKILKQRNFFLKSLKKQFSNAVLNQLEPWDLQLAETGSDIVFRRQQILRKFYPHFQAAHVQLSESDAIAITYQSSIGEIEALTQIEIMDKFIQQLHHKRRQDILYGSTSSGPHRDDLGFYLADKDLKLFGSQGQIRTVALALKMAEINFLSNYLNEKPILLLDDVFSELDLDRQKALIDYINVPDMQTFLTTTHFTDSVKRLMTEQSLFLNISQGAFSP
jgi:DNA replication and repair protein RecF